MKNTRKGFTGIELVIVIAIIAILAASLIPTFGGLIDSANKTADMQAVREMNTVLLQEEIGSGKPADRDAVIELLMNNGYADFNTYSAKRALGWVAEDNMIVLIELGDEGDTIIYPEECVGKEFVRINPTVVSVKDLLNLLKNGDGSTVFVGENITAENASDLCFEGDGVYSLNLAGKTIYTNVPNTAKGYNDGIIVLGNTQTTIVGGVIEGGSNVAQVMAVYDNATLVIEDSVISGGTSIAVLAEAGGTATVSNTKVLGAPGNNPLQAYGGTLVLNNVTASQSGENDEYWYNSVIQVANEIAKNEEGAWEYTGNDGYLTVNGGTYSGTIALQVSAPGGYVTINDGYFTGTNEVINAAVSDSYYKQGCRCEITINGGVFEGQIKVGSLVELTINGGTFSVDPTEWVAEGHTATANADGTWTVK